MSTLPAPPKEYAFDPMGQTPYSEYIVTVEAPGYNTVKIRGVQIFAETTTRQKIELTIIRQSDHRQNIEIIEIPPHQLTVQHPEQQPQPHSFGYNPGPYLRQVKIPKFIIVHDGHPEEQAPRYKIRFQDYIKNVAAHEIYPTWHKEAIIVNVLSIISFTLNRVFTRHYHAKGFDISTFTPIDQEYVHGKNTYHKINKVVDEIWCLFFCKAICHRTILSPTL
jgi:hypothetical protein